MCWCGQRAVGHRVGQGQTARQPTTSGHDSAPLAHSCWRCNECGCQPKLCSQASWRFLPCFPVAADDQCVQGCMYVWQHTRFRPALHNSSRQHQAGTVPEVLHAPARKPSIYVCWQQGTRRQLQPPAAHSNGHSAVAASRETAAQLSTPIPTLC